MDVAEEKSVKVSAERHRRLKLLAAHAGMGIAEVLEAFGGPGIDAELDRRTAPEAKPKRGAKPEGK